MSRDMGLSVAAGLVSAVVFLSVLAGGNFGMPLLYLIPLPLALIGLSYGMARAALSSFLAILVVAVAALGAVPVFLLIGPLPVLILVREVLKTRPGTEEPVRWAPAENALAWLALLGVVLMAGFAALLAWQGEGLAEMAGKIAGQAVEAMFEAGPASVKDVARAVWSALMPAILGIVWLSAMTLNGVVAQWTVTRAGHALRPSPAYSGILLPQWLAAAVLIAGAVGAAAPGDAGYVGRNAAVLLLSPYVLAGLAAIHRGLAGRNNAGLLLALFYVVFFLSFGWTVGAVALLGLVSDWTRHRRHDAVLGPGGK